MVSLLLIPMALWNAGCGGKYKAALTEDEYRRIVARTKPLPPDKILVNSEEVTAEEVVTSPVEFGGNPVPLDKYLSPVAKNTDPNQFKEIARNPIESSLDRKIANIILYKKAKTEAGGDKIDDTLEKMAEQKWREFVAVKHNGNEADADAALQEFNMTRAQFKEFHKRDSLSQYHVYSQVPSDRPISHRELIAYYEIMKDEFFLVKPTVTFRLIDIQPSRLRFTEITLDPKEQARALARDLLEQLKAGADFAELAKTHSHGFSRNVGGLWKPRDPTTLAAPYDVLGHECEVLAPGEIAGPIEVQDHVFLLKLESKQEGGYQPLAQVQAQVQAQIIADRRLAATKKLNAELEERAAAGQTDAFIEVCANEIYQREQGK